MFAFVGSAGVLVDAKNQKEVTVIFVNLGRIKNNPIKEEAGDTDEILLEFKKKGIKVLNWYWTLGRYLTVFIFEAESEKEALGASLDISDWVATETLIAIPRQEAAGLI